jgi:hypothetical protein
LEDFLTNDADTIIKGVTVLGVEVDGVAVKHPLKYRATSPSSASPPIPGGPSTIPASSRSR